MQGNLPCARTPKNATSRVMEFRIPLKMKASLNLASVANNDPYFYGDQFVKYPDGTVCLHVELIGETTEATTRGMNPNSGKFRNIPNSVQIPSVSDESNLYMEETVDPMNGSTRCARSTRSRASKYSPKSQSNRSIVDGFSVGSARSRCKSTAGSTIIGSKRKLRKSTHLQTVSLS